MKYDLKCFISLMYQAGRHREDWFKIMYPFKPFHSQSERERLCKAVLTFESVDEILCSDHSNEISSAVLSHRTNYLVCCSNF